jgi:alkylation response protein AidB-like acyl-CoA dehydrogenase
MRERGAPARRRARVRARARRGTRAARGRRVSARRGACCASTAGYAGTREQFGTRLAQFQAVKHQLANAVTEIEPSRGLLWYARTAVDHLPERAAHAAAVAKAHITDRAIGVARDAVELHGGIGYTWESDVQIWFKRVLFDRALAGNARSAPRAQRARCQVGR